MVDRVDWTTPLEEERKYARMSNTERITYMLTKIMNQVEVVVRRTSHFVAGMKDIISSMNPQEYAITLQNIEYLRGNIVAIPAIIQSTGFKIADDALRLYVELDKTDSAMEQVISVINNPTYERLSRTSASASIIVDSQLNRDAARRAHANYATERVQDDTIITDYITDMIIASAERGDCTYSSIFEFIITHADIVNKFTVKLISKIINVVSDDQRRQLELLVEKQKDEIIGSSRVDISMNSGIDGMITRYGLVPATNNMSMSELIKLLTDGTVLGEDLAEVARTLNTGIIVLSIANSSPINFDLRGLIDAKYINENKLTAGKTTGLNKTVLAKYETAELIGVSAVTPMPLQYYGDNTSTHWHIIESITSGMYRCLGLPETIDKISIGEIPMVALRRVKTSSSKNKKSKSNPARAAVPNPAIIIDKNPQHAHINMRIPRDQIRGLFDGLSTRCCSYNNICGETIVKKAIDKQLIVVADEYELLHKDTSGIAHAIVVALTEQFTKLNPEITSAEHYRVAALARESTQMALLKVFVHTTGTRGRGQDEYMISFVAKFDMIFGRFMRELEQHITIPSARIFQELSARDLHKELVGAYRAAVEVTTRELEKIKLWDNYDTSLKQFTLDKRFIVV